jgi:hypothetical protein
MARLGRSLKAGRLCPPLWRLNRAVSTALVPRIGWHLSSCTACLKEYEFLAGISTWMASLPRHELGDASRDDITVSLLAAPPGRARG